MTTNVKNRYVHSVYMAKMIDRNGAMIAVYAGKHRVRAPAFCTSRTDGHLVYRDSYAGGGLYITTADRVKWPSYRYVEDSWPGLFANNPGAKIDVSIIRNFLTDAEARKFETWLISELRRHWPRECCNRDSV